MGHEQISEIENGKHMKLIREKPQPTKATTPATCCRAKGENRINIRELLNFSE